ncbi:MAG: 2'-deoxycytidine 5'-triphosphate deaminase, partial [Armatimonadota bacterium]|nr:2'-deoxycytidine 5'-triphosphate deaminase [Armatimonadota bacterium]
GLIVHATAGFIDPGFEGNVTLELSNVANLPIRLYPGMKVGQISFFALSTPADRPYGHPELGSKYKGQAVPTASRMHLNFRSEEDQK